MKTGELLQKERERHKMSQRALALKSGVSNATISRIEALEVTPDTNTLSKLATALNIDITFLIGEELAEQSKEFENAFALKDIYFHLGKEAQDMGLQQEDIEMMLDFARIHQERNKKK